MNLHRMYFNNTANTLVCVNEAVCLPMVRKLGHAYDEWCLDALYTYSEVQKIDKHFFHAKSVRLYSVMQHADVPNVEAETLNQPQDMASECDMCQRLAKEPS